MMDTLSRIARATTPRIMPKITIAALATGGLAATSTLASPVDVGFPQYPSISPDGETIVFSWRADLWAVPSGGGVATRITSHPADEMRSAFSNDGTMLAFESSRGGSMNLYVADLAGSGDDTVISSPRRVTTLDSSQQLSAFGADDQSLLYASYQDYAVFRHRAMFDAPLDGGPVLRITDAHGQEPIESHDGNTLFFQRGYTFWERPTYRGPGVMDIHRLDLDTNTFTQVTDSGANDGLPFPLPDGSLVFVSSRDGQNNIFRIPAGGTDDNAQQLTRFSPGIDDATIGHGVRDLAVSRDGTTATFVVWDTLYTLDLTRNGAQPVAIDVTASGDDAGADVDTMTISTQISDAAVSPDGGTLAVVARGEVFVRSTKEDHPTRRVTFGEARERDVVWSADGKQLYIVSDRNGTYDIYAAEVDLAREDIMPSDDEPADAAAVEETPEPGTPEPGDPAGDPAGDPDEPADTPEADAADEDASAEEEADDAKKKDTPDYGKRWADSLTYTLSEIVVSDDENHSPAPSPDGSKLAFVRGLGDIHILDLDTGDISLLHAGWDAPQMVWVSDSEHLVVARSDINFNNDVWLFNTSDTDAAPVNISRHPDIDTSPSISHDGKILAFLSDRAGENWDYDVYTVNLDDKLDGLRGYERDAYFTDAGKAAKKIKPAEPRDDTNDEDAGNNDAKAKDDTDEAEGMEFDTDDAYLRVQRRTTIPGSEGNLVMTPAGDRLIFTASVDGSRGLYSIKHDGSDRKLIQSGGVGNVMLSLTGDKVFFTHGGQVKSASPTGGKVTSYPINARINVDLANQQIQKFEEAARTFGDTFYHPTIKGLDWDALTERYAQLAENTRTSQEFNRAFQLMLGEVDASHTGISGGPSGFSAPSPANGFLGIDATPVADGYRVDRVYEGGPADRETSRLHVGDVILAVNGEPLASPDTAAGVVDLHAAFAGTAGRETLVEIRRAADEGNAEENIGDPSYVLITPISSGARRTIRYNAEVESRRQMVEDMSDGKLGYLHIRGMSAPSVRDFERDLFAVADGKEGLVIDVRDNGGGWTTDILLASLTAPRHAYTIPRGADPATVPDDAYPRDRRLIYGYSRPISVLINENSFSNAEIFAHSIKTIGRGTIVGTQTFGGVISTGSFSLIDGTRIRRPFRGWYLPDGTDMEHNGTIPDIPVADTPADQANNRDPQLEAAVNELLSRTSADSRD